MSAHASTAPPTPRAADDVSVPDRSADLRRLTRINVGLAVLLVIAVAAIATTVLLLSGSPTATRADAASSARWDGAAAQYEATRTARSNAAGTARLDAAAEHHEAIRRTAALDADAARLTRQAEQRAGR